MEILQKSNLEFSDAQVVTSVARSSEVALAELYRRHSSVALRRRRLTASATLSTQELPDADGNEIEEDQGQRESQH